MASCVRLGRKMGKSDFIGSSTRFKPWWFTLEELTHISKVCSFQSSPERKWTLIDASPSQDIDAINVIAGDKCVCISKRIDRETGRPVYDIASAGQKPRTVRVFPAAHAALAVCLQHQARLDHVWAQIEKKLPDTPALK
jgi:hypothetical protein